MKITVYAHYAWDGTLIAEEAYEYVGLTELCKGASAQEGTIAANQQAFAGALQNDFGQAFAGQQNILSNLTSGLTNIQQAGPSQFGFSPSEVNTLNTQADSGTAAQYQNAKQAAGEAAAAAGGGNAFLPSGATLQQNTALANSAAQQSSSQKLGIQQAGYAQGAANYNNAVSGLLNVSNQYSPNSYASSTNSANQGAFSSANAISQENNAASPWNVIGGALGGLASTALNWALPGAGSLSGLANKAIGPSQIQAGFSTFQPTPAPATLDLGPLNDGGQVSFP